MFLVCFENLIKQIPAMKNNNDSFLAFYILQYLGVFLDYEPLYSITLWERGRSLIQIDF
jgi:hypothetical protein